VRSVTARAIELVKFFLHPLAVLEFRMAKKRDPEAAPEVSISPPDKEARETPFESFAGICSVLVVGLFALTLLGQNFVIPSGSMKNTLLIGDHVLVDRITFSSATRWMPLVHHRDPQRNDIVVFIRPAPEPEPDADGNPVYSILVKRLIGMPGDHIHLHGGTVYINGVAQPMPQDGLDSPAVPSELAYEDEFPSVLPTVNDPHGAVTTWVVDLPNHIENGDLVVPPGNYFMMGDHRHASLDSRFWGFVPRENIMGRPLFNYWSFETPADQQDKKGLANQVAWLSHVVVHFFTDTRWSRTFNPVR
jgi:signal peptidase I